MNKLYLKYLGLLPIYLFIQVLILNQILFFSYINPFLYILLILTLPLKTPKWFLLTYAFLLGISIDVFSYSIGFHSTACVLLAFFKPLISKISVPHNTLGESDEMTLGKINIKSYVIFVLILTLIHHSCLFIIENLHFSLNILLKIIASSVVSLIIILITQLLTQKNK